MSIQTTESAPHLTDEELLRLIDAEGDAAWRADRDGHIAACSRCARELELLGADALVVREWVDRAAFEASLPARTGHAPARTAHAADPAQGRGRARRFVSPDRASSWRLSPGLRAAAVLALLAAPVAALPGVRAWLADAVTGSDPVTDVRTTSAPAASPTAAVIRFVPEAGAFVVDLAAAQAAGVLQVGRAAGAEAVLESTAEPAAGPIVSASSLRILNASGDEGSYMLQVPAGVTRVTVRVAGSVITVIDAATLNAGTAVPLR
jgi:hypothetical protein